MNDHPSPAIKHHAQIQRGVGSWGLDPLVFQGMGLEMVKTLTHPGLKLDSTPRGGGYSDIFYIRSRADFFFLGGGHIF